jgi:hypothetical protein
MLRLPVRALLPSLALLIAALAGAGPAWPPPEEVTLTNEELLLEDPYTGHFRSRFWYINAMLVDGTALTVSLFQWRYGLLGDAGLLVLCAQPGAETYVLETKLDELEVAGDRLHYRFGESLLEGDAGGARVRLRLPDFSCDLELRNLLNPWKPGDGYVYLSRQRDVYTRHSVTSPFAEVSGSLEVRGRWRPAEGWCYADRGIVAMPLSRMNPEQFSFRVFGPVGDGEPWMLSLLESVSARAYGSRRVASLLLARGGEWLLATADHESRAEEYYREAGVPFAFPHRFRVRARQDGRTLDGEFVVSKLFHLNDILRRLPPAFRAVAEALIRRPVIYRLAGDFHGYLEEADGSRVILELRGQGEYSIMR